MSIRLRPVATALLLAAVTIIFYGAALGRQPIGPDEARVLSFAQQPGHSVEIVINTGESWLQPIGVYATALVHAAMPGFYAGRWASVIVGAINAALLFLVAWRLFTSSLAAVVATLILILMPAHMIYARQGVDAIYIIPFVLLWLYALLEFLRNDRLGAVALASAALGAGVYATTAAPLTMAFLFATMIVVLWSSGRRKPPTFVVAAASFAVMLAPLAIFFALNPHTYMDTYGSWVIHPAHLRNPVELVQSWFNSNTLGTRASAYWSVLDPSFLFFSSDEGRAPLHWATAPLIVLGLYRCAAKRSPASVLILAGTFVAPLAGAAFGQPRYIVNALAWLPFLALLAGYGVVFVRELITGPTPPAPVEEY